MSRTLSDILIDVNSYLDLDASLPIGDDLEVRVNYAKQAVREWADYYRWKDLSTPLTALATNTTLSLPTNFRELETQPKDANNNYYPEIPQSESVYKDSTDKYSFITGNQAQGYIATFHNLSSLATISLTYQRQPSNMATLTDVCEVPDDQYVVYKVISLVLQSRSDERFPLVEADANRRLRNMVSRNNIIAQGGISSTPKIGSALWSIGRSRG